MYKVTYWQDWQQKEALFETEKEARRFAYQQDQGWTITGPDGKDAGTVELPAPIRGREEKRLSISTRISKPDLWSPATERGKQFADKLQQALSTGEVPSRPMTVQGSD